MGQRKEIKLIEQQDQMDCGVACIQMILDFYGTVIPINHLRDLTGTDKEGASALGIKKCLEYLNFDCIVIEADESVWNYPDLSYPLIANIIVDEAYYHYVVIYGKEGEDLLIADPSKGLYRENINLFSKVWTKVLIMAEPKEDYVPQKIKTGGLLSFLPILFKSKKLISLIILLSFIVTILSIVGSYYLQSVIDNVIPQKNLNLINILSIGIMINYLIKSLITLIKDNLLNNLGQRMNLEIITNYFHHTILLPMNFFSARKTGDIISRFLDASRIIDALASATLSIFLDVTMFVLVGAVLLYQNSTLFLVTILSLPIYLIVILYFTKKFEKANKEQMEMSAVLNSDIIEVLDGIETIKSHQGEQYIISRIDQTLYKFMAKIKIALYLDNVQTSIKTLIDLLTSAIIIWLGAYHILNNQMSLGELITYNSLLVFFTTPLQNIVNLQVKLQTAEIASKRINEVLLVKEEGIDKRGLEIISINEGISTSQLNFSYSMKTPILKDINVKIKTNEKVSIVGMSGSGKSTLAKLFVKFYDPSSGNICIDNQDILKISNSSLRKLITYVPQQPFLFSGTISDNLTFGRNRSLTRDEIVEACKIAEILDFINTLPMGFDTVIEEGGVNLSGGQRKRLALARSILSDSQFYIFDEITSEMDSILEKKIVTNLLKLESKTMIFITHSLNIAKQCDMVYVMRDGEVVESGTHDELIKAKAEYENMWLQSFG